MKRILVATVTALLIATAGVKAGPPIPFFADQATGNLAEAAQFKKKGKGFKRGKGRFKKGAFKKKGGGKKGPHCFSRCVAKGKFGPECNVRCR
jgi:hypothetical protein